MRYIRGGGGARTSARASKPAQASRHAIRWWRERAARTGARVNILALANTAMGQLSPKEHADGGIKECEVQAGAAVLLLGDG